MNSGPASPGAAARAEASFALAQTLWLQGDLEGAAAKLREALESAPDLAEGHNNLGLVYKALRQYDAAVASFRRALAINPSIAWVHCNLANTLQEQGDREAAIASYRHALALDRHHADAWVNLAHVLKDEGDLQEAVRHYRQALALRPDHASALIGLGSALQLQGELDRALASFRRALSLEPGNAEAASGVLFTMNVHPGCSPAERLAEARSYGQVLMSRVRPFTRWSVDLSDRAAGRIAPLRIGLVSGDLRIHPVGFFLENVLQHLDSSRFELIAYSTLAHEDALAARIRPRFAAWHSIVGSSDEAAARTMHEDRLHLLIDLSGHTAHNRLSVLARKPAPVQVTWLGYFATTGLPAIDYVLADRMSVPESQRDRFTETVWYLPEGRFCFTPPAEAERFAPAPSPALRQGVVTFGSFQNLLKLNDAVLAAWSRILRALPRARLRVQNSAMGFARSRARFEARLGRAGVALDRVALVGSVPRDDYLRAHAEVDLILDPFPYGGATTTCEALWMGVPTLTLAGDTLVSRQGASLLASAGLDEWIARDERDYVDRAIRLATDVNGLARLRSRLREQVLASPVFDAPRFAQALQEALSGMWDEGSARRRSENR